MVFHGAELWRSNGTAAGTTLVKDINLSGSSAPAWLTNINGDLYFSASNQVHGFQIWRSIDTNVHPVSTQYAGEDSDVTILATMESF